MKTALITGMSGTGKTTVIAELSARGYNAFDLDNGNFSMWIDVEDDSSDPDNEVQPGKDWVWNEAKVTELLASQDTGPLFLSGCASNMHKFYSRFDHIILLTASDNIIIERLGVRQGDAYGQTPDEVDRVLRLKQFIEPLLRSNADFEIDTSIPNQSAAELILRYMNAGRI